MEQKDIFDILGVSNREDIYTDLLGYAFSQDALFRQKFCGFFGADTDGCLVIRPTVTLPGSELKNDGPDMIMYSARAKIIILIVNKMFSGEGWGQTKRYADPLFAEQLHQEYLPQAAHVTYAYYYLTLDGRKAMEPKFQSRAWSDLAKCCYDHTLTEDPYLDFLYRGLVNRAVLHDSLQAPSPDTGVQEYFQQKTGWITWGDLYNKLMDTVTESLLSAIPAPLYARNSWATNGRKEGYYVTCLMQSDWLGSVSIDDHTPQDADGRGSYDIHYEFQYREKDELATLYIHYHTRPYLSDKGIQAYRLKHHPVILAALDKKVHAYRHAIQSNLFGPEWDYLCEKKVLESSVFIAKKDIDMRTITVAELTQELIHLVGSTVDKMPMLIQD